MFDANGNLQAVGYAGGDKGLHPEGVNNPKMQNVVNIGPLPCGHYTIGAPIDNPVTGPYSLPLTPDSANEMYGRGGFFLHGDDIRFPGQRKGSDGCPVVDRASRETVWASLDRDFEVVTLR